MSQMRKHRMPSKFFGAEFTIAIGCQLNCWYCPQQKLIQSYVSLFGNDDLLMTFEIGLPQSHWL